MEKKNSILMMICAFMSVASIGVSAGCANFFGGNAEESSAKESSVKTESSVELESYEDVVSSEQLENSEGIESMESMENTESLDSSDSTEVPVTNPLTISSPEGEVFPYVDEAKAFLQAGEGADVADYYVSGLKNPQKAITIKWKYNAEGARKFLVEYATKDDYSDAIVVEMGAAKRSLDVYNLYKGTQYYLRITALNAKDEVLHTAETQFETTALGPRVMNVEGAYNVRDLGGFDTIFGKQIVQGIAYRGGMLHYNATGNNGDLTDAGRKTLSEELGIKAELDFRNEEESWVTLEDGSSIPGAKLTYITAGGYEDLFKGGDKPYRQIFAYLADKNNYPLYFHCTAGADRTGSVSYILHAFLGVSELECHQDFAFTSFSIYGIRASQSGRGDNSQRYMNMVSMLKEWEGDTLQKKAENYLLSIGVTAQELETIKGIFFGEIVIGDDAAKDVKEMPVARVAEKKTLNEMLVETTQGWTIQKKED